MSFFGVSQARLPPPSTLLVGHITHYVPASRLKDEKNVNFPALVITTPLTEPCLRYLRTRLLNSTLHVRLPQLYKYAWCW